MADTSERIIVEDDPLVLESREILDEEPSTGPSLSDLQAMYEAEKKKNEDLTGRADSTQALRASFDGFKETLQGVVQRPQYVQQAPPSQEDDMTALMEDFDKNFLDAPSKRILKLNSKMLQGPLEGIVNSQFAMAKRLVQVESTEKDLFKQYEREIEGEFAKIPVQERAGDPVAAYERCFSMVKGRHFDEIFAARAAGAQKSAPQPAQEPKAGSVPQQSSPMAKPQAAQQGAIRLKPGQRDRIETLMRQNGIHESNFGEYVELLHDKGVLGSI